MRYLGLLAALAIVAVIGWNYWQRQDLASRINTSAAERCGVSQVAMTAYTEQLVQGMGDAQRRGDKAAQQVWLRRVMECPSETTSDVQAVEAALGNS